MKQNNILAKLMLVGILGSASVCAEMTVKQSNDILMVTSNIHGIVIATIIGPNEKKIVDKKYNGSSFSWAPSGPDGSYRYDVRVIPTSGNSEHSSLGDYAAGMISVVDGQIVTRKAGGKL